MTRLSAKLKKKLQNNEFGLTTGAPSTIFTSAKKTNRSSVERQIEHLSARKEQL